MIDSGCLNNLHSLVSRLVVGWLVCLFGYLLLTYLPYAYENANVNVNIELKSPKHDNEQFFWFGWFKHLPFGYTYCAMYNNDNNLCNICYCLHYFPSCIIMKIRFY